MSISSKQLNEMLKSGNAKIVDTGWRKPDMNVSGTKKRQSIPQSQPKGLVFIKNTLLAMKIHFVTEHVFDEEKKRKFRFDIALPDRKIAIEYEGILNAEKSRHTHVLGYTRDTEKYNLAVIQGWRVLRYTGTESGAAYAQFPSDIKKLLG